MKNTAKTAIAAIVISVFTCFLGGCTLENSAKGVFAAVDERIVDYLTENDIVYTYEYMEKQKNPRSIDMLKLYSIDYGESTAEISLEYENSVCMCFFDIVDRERDLDGEMYTLLELMGIVYNGQSDSASLDDIMKEEYVISQTETQTVYSFERSKSDLRAGGFTLVLGTDENTLEVHKEVLEDYYYD